MTFRCCLAIWGMGMLSLLGQVRGEEFWNDLPLRMEKDPAALEVFSRSHKISDTDSGGWAIHWLARSGKTEALRRVVRKGADVNQATVVKQQTRPIELAAGKGWAEGVAVLLELGAELKGETRVRAMRMASSHGEDGTPKVVQILVKAGVSPNWSGAVGFDFE